MSGSNVKGIGLMVAAVASFSVLDAFSRKLAGDYNTLMVVAVRYWAFAAFVLVMAARRREGFSRAVATRHLGLHLLRATLLVAEICLMVLAFTRIGLIETHAVFAVTPLAVVALSGPILAERIGVKRWLAVGVGLAGVLILLRPGLGVVSPAALLPLGSATMFGLFSVLTRFAARGEARFTVFFWPAVLGAVLMTPLGLANWQAVAPGDWPGFAAYAGFGILSNWLLTRTYEVAEASAVQPFAYLQFVFVSMLGMAFFGERLGPVVLLGAAVVIGAGLFSLAAARGEARAAKAQEPA